MESQLDVDGRQYKKRLMKFDVARCINRIEEKDIADEAVIKDHGGMDRSPQMKEERYKSLKLNK